MFTTLTVQLPTDTLLQLIEKLRRRGGSQDLSEALAQALLAWLAEPARFESGAESTGLRGYQWKSLFLPEGTVLKSWSYGENNYARVVGDEIIHKGRVVSPNQFAQAFARSTRNAWSDLYIRRPGDKSFTIACRLRKELAREDYARREGPEPTAALTLIPPPQPAQVPIGNPAPARDGTPEPGWDLPERRKFRYRLEDVSF